ncbi:MAG: hypothetical protein AAFO69_13660, partial [Bacteroidota bacterium]
VNTAIISPTGYSIGLSFSVPSDLAESVSSQLIKFGEKSLQVEMRMWDKEMKELKSVLWAKFTHFDLKQLKPKNHLNEFGDLFEKILTPVQEEAFEARTASFLSKRQVDSV